MFYNLKADLARLSPAGRPSLRTLVAGLLSQGFQAILVFRVFHWLHSKGWSGQPIRFLMERFIEITTGISIPAQCRIGKGLRIHHFGGIIFHPTVQLGENCTLYQGVTIGDRGGSGGAARIGNNVLLGAGSKVIGDISIGDNCIVGANAVVTKDMPPNTVAVGSPCRFKELSLAPPAVEDVAGHNVTVPRVMDLRGTYKGGGGPDKTVLNSAAQHDPAQVHVLVTYLRQPHDHEFQIPRMAAELGIEYTDVIDGKGVDLRCLRQLKRILKQNKLTVLHAHDDKTLLYGWLLKLLTPGLRIMYTCHSHASHQRNEFPSGKAYLKFKVRQGIQIFLMRRYLKPIITVSEDTRKRLVRHGLKSEDVTVLHNGIDIEKWSPGKGRPVLREELGLGKDDFLVGTVARITYEKDLPTFYQVASQVASRFPNTKFVVVGDGYGNELPQAREEVKRLGLDELIWFTGHRNDLFDIYSSFDVFLMTSITEGLPNTTLEAMAMGIPVVSTDVGGVPELVVDGSSGLLAPAGDIDRLAQHLIGLLEDGDRRGQFGRGARQRIEDAFNFNARVRAMENFYWNFSALEKID